MGKIKMVALDLDGTTLDNFSKFSHKTVTAINDVLHDGVNVIFDSGRDWTSIERLLLNSGIDLQSDHLYLCGLNGAHLVNQRSKDILYNKKIEWTLCQKVANDFKELSAENFNRDVLIDFAYFNVDLRHLNIQVNPRRMAQPVAAFFVSETKKDVKRDGRYQVDFTEIDFNPNLIFQKLYISLPKQELTQLMVKWSHCLEFSFEQSSATPGNYQSEITPLRVTKATGIEFLAKQLGIDLQTEAIAIGNESNDLPMFNCVGHAIAVDNAPDHIKSWVKHVTSSNHKDGVAEALEMFCKS